MSKIQRSIELIADSIDSGYSALFTFAVKENLNNEERAQIAGLIRNLAIDSKDFEN